MKAIKVPNGIVHLSESKAYCPHCTRLAEIDELEEKYYKSNKGHIKHKCKGCKRFIGITVDIKGDFRSYEL